MSEKETRARDDSRLSVMVGGLPPVREMKEGGGGRALDFSESHLS